MAYVSWTQSHIIEHHMPRIQTTTNAYGCCCVMDENEKKKKKTVLDAAAIGKMAPREVFSVRCRGHSSIYMLFSLHWCRLCLALYSLTHQPCHYALFARGTILHMRVCVCVSIRPNGRIHWANINIVHMNMNVKRVRCTNKNTQKKICLVSISVMMIKKNGYNRWIYGTIFSRVWVVKV